MKMKFVNDDTSDTWDAYVRKHPDSTAYHLWGFSRAVNKIYKHKTMSIAAYDGENNITGVFPLFYIKSFLFGNELVSLPFCDYGGILADNEDIALLLVNEAKNILNRLKINILELRQTFSLEFFNSARYPYPIGESAFLALQWNS